MKYVMIATLFTGLVACEGSIMDNPADHAGDYSLEEVSLLEAADEEIMEETLIEEVEMGEFMEVPVSEQAPPPPPDVSEGRKLVRTANLSVQVSNLENSARVLDSLLVAHQAYISRDDLQNSPTRKSRELVIRVPSDNLEELVAGLAEMGQYLERKSVFVRDVTANYTDTELRLKSKRAVLDQYLKLLERADKIEDILKIEKEIRLIREEIEAKEGTLRVLSDRIVLGTISLDMYQEITHAEAAPSDNFLRKAGQRLAFGWDLIKFLTLGLLSIWPLMVAGAAWLLVVRLRKRRSRLV